jgi:hypothetical protein
MPSSHFKKSLKVFAPRSIMSRMISSDQRSPSISTDAFSGHLERGVGRLVWGIKLYVIISLANRK